MTKKEVTAAFPSDTAPPAVVQAASMSNRPSTPPPAAETTLSGDESLAGAGNRSNAPFDAPPAAAVDVPRLVLQEASPQTSPAASPTTPRACRNRPCPVHLKLDLSGAAPPGPDLGGAGLRSPLSPSAEELTRSQRPGCVLAATYRGQTTLAVDDVRKLDKHELADMVSGYRSVFVLPPDRSVSLPSFLSSASVLYPGFHYAHAPLM